MNNVIAFNENMSLFFPCQYTAVKENIPNLNDIYFNIFLHRMKNSLFYYFKVSFIAQKLVSVGARPGLKMSL